MPMLSDVFENPSLDSREKFNSGSINNIMIRKIRMANIGTYNHWYRKPADKYGAATLLLPLGSIVVLTVVILLMVMFKRCPHLAAATVFGILGTIVIFTVLVTVDHPAVYE